MLEKLVSGIKGAWSRMFGRNMIGSVIPKTVITDEMEAHIDKWANLYYGKAPWLMHNKLSLGLPAAIAREVATLVTLEAKIEVGNVKLDREEETEINPRAQFISESLKPVIDQITAQTEYACALGGVVFRPYIDGDRIAIDCINADNFFPIAFNARGEITGAAFCEKKRDKGETYTRIEIQQMGNDGVYSITNRAFKSWGDSETGTPCPLESVDEWKDIQPDITINGVKTPLFSYFKIPSGNTVNVDSPLGVSVFARAEQAGILEEADKQLQRLSWEYEAGEIAIDASIDAFRTDREGHPILPTGKERLYRINELSGMDSAGSSKFQIYAPSLRDSSYSEGLNRLLMRVEDLCGIARGTFSDANESVRTATELKISKQRTYATVTSIQTALQRAIDGLARAIDTLATLYNLAPEGEYAISYTWDDSVVVDAQAERESDRQDVLDGIMQDWEYRMKWYGETEAKARDSVAGGKIAEKALNEVVEEPEEQME